MTALAIDQALADLGLTRVGEFHFPKRGWLRRKLDDFVTWMAGSKAFYSSKKTVELIFGGVAFTAPGNVYLALCTVAVTDSMTGSTITETDYTSYARTLIGTSNNQTDAWNAATGTTTATVTNKNAISAPTATGASTNPIIALALVDASSAGNVLGWCDVTSTAIASGDTPKINASGLTIVED